MPEKIESKEEAMVKDATISEYQSAHVAIVTIGGKQFRVNIPANSNHPPVGKNSAIKDKWRRTEFSKDEAEAFNAKRKEFATKAAGSAVAEPEKK